MAIKYYHSTTNWRLMFHVTLWSATLMIIVLCNILYQLHKTNIECIGG
mgnify:FL=1